ncbi:hypothetical protein HMPREF1548_03442 [Clostridium sp. KLE 1755]|nr:hypothetical protein HMPREF1548_03442 [Clostridium sp. KLE 1755]
MENMNPVPAAQAPVPVVMPAVNGFNPEGTGKKALFHNHAALTMMITVFMAEHTQICRGIQIFQPRHGTIFIRVHHQRIPAGTDFKT